MTFFSASANATATPPHANNAWRAMKSASMDVARLHDLFILTNDGRLINKSMRSSRSAAGREAGHVANNGYRSVGIAGRAYLAHRVIFAMANGRWPRQEIDHIDGDRLNNRPANLREVSSSENAQNQRRAKTTNVSGMLGVSVEVSGRYEASIKLNSLDISLGRFASKEQASEVYRAAKKILHPGAYDVRDTQVECFSSCETVIAFRRFLSLVESSPGLQGLSP